MFQWYTSNSGCFPKGGRQCPFYPQAVNFQGRLWGQGDVPALSFSSLSRANIFGMAKKVAPQGWWVWWAGRCCPPNGEAQSMFPWALPFRLSLRGPAFPSPPVSPLSQASAQGRCRTAAQARICMQARRGQSGLVSRLCLKQKTQAKVNSTSGGEWFWASMWVGASTGAPAEMGSYFTSCDPPEWTQCITSEMPLWGKI